ncbi:MAG: ribosome recycling factor [Neisseriales bacterium]|jgi:ribosome recycling factor|nr:MAG: ribosome recycling factor [Neisseriales bacterium]HRG62048.1 ribosome recycling factor [Burkholderiales bacterium]
MTSEIKKQAETKMGKSLDSYKNTLTKIRTGRAHAGLLDHVQIDYYGAMMPINQVATVTASDARTLTVQPFEAKMSGAIEKAIRDADLGLNPATNGNTVRVPMPALTEERRKELIKVVKGEAEEAKVAVRNVRRDANSELKAKLKDKAITEDDDKRTQDEIQKFTDKYIAEIDKLTADKEKELLTV